MIQQIQMYQCICNNCGSVIPFGEGWTSFTYENLKDWIANEEHSMQVIDGKHICCDCITYNEDGNVVINESRQPQSARGIMDIKYPPIDTLNFIQHLWDKGYRVNNTYGQHPSYAINGGIPTPLRHLYSEYIKIEL